MDLDKMPLIKALLQHSEKKSIPFHMPGHKENARQFEELELIRQKFFQFDKTEVSELDNLHLPQGAIKEAQDMAAKAFCAARSWFLVNGSTCGIYAMITAVTHPGDKIIVQRNCHRSIHMAAFLGELEVRYVNPVINPDFGIPSGLELSEVIKIMDQNMDAKAIVLVHPSYHGICSDLESIVFEAHKRNMLVLVDEAHGAHFPFGDDLPKASMLCGADISVTSVHKSLPALTQASLLNINKSILNTSILDNLIFMLRLYQSTSPSYILMASIDAARNIMEKNGRKLLGELLHNIEAFKESMKSVDGFMVLDQKHAGQYGIADIDRTKLVINSRLGGVKLSKILEKEFDIIVEMADMYNIILITSVGDVPAYFEKLYKALLEIARRIALDQKKIELQLPPDYVYSCNMRTAFYSPKHSVNLSESAGCVSAEMIVPYPPGIPILLPGELITDELLGYVERIKKEGIQITGLEDTEAKCIKVISKI